MTEDQFQSTLIEAARLLGWLAYHTHDSRRSEPGFPDLVLVHPKRRRLVFAELKSERGTVKPAQLRWHEALIAAGQEIYVWRPADLQAAVKLLGGQLRN